MSNLDGLEDHIPPLLDGKGDILGDLYIEIESSAR